MATEEEGGTASLPTAILTGPKLLRSRLRKRCQTF